MLQSIKLNSLVFEDCVDWRNSPFRLGQSRTPERNSGKEFVFSYEDSVFILAHYSFLQKSPYIMKFDKLIFVNSPIIIYQL